MPRYVFRTRRPLRLRHFLKRGMNTQNNVLQSFEFGWTLLNQNCGSYLAAEFIGNSHGLCFAGVRILKRGCYAQVNLMLTAVFSRLDVWRRRLTNI